MISFSKFSLKYKADLSTNGYF